MTATADRIPAVVRDAIKRVVEHNQDSEAADYAECGVGGNSREEHIYLDLVLLGRWLGIRDGQEAQPRPAALKSNAAELESEISDLTGTWDRTDEAGTGLEADIENAGRRLESLARETAALVGPEDPQAAAGLLRLASRLDSAVGYYEALDEHDTNAGIDIIDRLGSGIGLVQDALRAHENGIPAGTLDAISEFRGCMADGYTSEDVNRVLGAIGRITGVNLACVWDISDSAGTGGNSDFYILDEDGRFRELTGNLWRWLNDDPEDPEATPSPGSPGTWTGPPAEDFTVNELEYHDGFLNYAPKDLRGPGEREAGSAGEQQAPEPGPPRPRSSRPRIPGADRSAPASRTAR